MTDPTHPFSYDLDIFGENSFFQQINRTVLPIGEQRLAEMIQNPLTDKDAILGRQQTIMELAGKEEFCLHFRTAGMKISSSSVKELHFTASSPNNGLSQNKIWNAAVWITPFLYLVFYPFMAYRNCARWPLSLSLSFHIRIILIPMKRVKAIWMLFDKRSKRLDAFATLFKISEQEKCESQLLKSLQKATYPSQKKLLMRSKFVVEPQPRRGFYTRHAAAEPSVSMDNALRFEN